MLVVESKLLNSHFACQKPFTNTLTATAIQLLKTATFEESRSDGSHLAILAVLYFLQTNPFGKINWGQEL
jgi:hypothetical protein